MDYYQQKYYKYKTKYLNLVRAMRGGGYDVDQQRRCVRKLGTKTVAIILDQNRDYYEVIYFDESIGRLHQSYWLKEDCTEPKACQSPLSYIKTNPAEVLRKIDPVPPGFRSQI